MSRIRICAHCSQRANGYAAINNQPLCHPPYDDAPDCYQLVTVYRHPLNCNCDGSGPTLEELDNLFQEFHNGVQRIYHDLLLKGETNVRKLPRPDR